MDILITVSIISLFSGSFIIFFIIPFIVYYFDQMFPQLFPLVSLIVVSAGVLYITGNAEDEYYTKKSNIIKT